MWFENLEGITDDQKAFLTENSKESPEALINLARKGSDWRNGLNDDNKGFAESKGFKDLDNIIGSYRNLESTVGAPPERIVKLPSKSIEEDPKAWEEVFNQMGRPENQDGYDIKAGEGTQVDEEVVKWAKETFYKLGMSKRQAESFISEWNKLADEKSAELNAGKQYADIEAEKELRMKWGKKYDANVGGVFAVAKQLGISTEEMNAFESTFGKVRTFEMLQSVSEKVGEHDYVGGGGNAGGVMNPSEARYKISERQNDPEWMKAWANGDADKVREMERLVVMANPDAS